MASPAPKRPTPYRAVLTPNLHRNFVKAGGLAFSVCYAEAVYMGLIDWFWSWFPVGPTGARTLMLSLSVLLVMIIRVSRLHVGRRTTTSPFETFRSQLTAPSTYITFAWYCISALLFAEVYVWARPVDAGFGVIDHGRAHERARLNERAIAFRTLFVMLGVVQSLIHLFSDRDRVPAQTRKVDTDAKSSLILSAAESPTILIRKAMPGIVFRLVWTATLFPVTAFILYVATPLRMIAWNIAFDTLRFLYFLPAKQRNIYSGFAPILPFYAATVVQTSLLVFLWEVTNAAFSAYIAQPPLRRGQPLTAIENNKTGKVVDPNGTLINGLKSKKEFARSSAFHELLLITFNYSERRKTIYSELDRVGGNSWSQISKLCLAQIEGITTRINGLNPAPSPPPAEVPERKPIAPPLKTDNVFAPALPMGTPARTGEWAKSVAAKYGNSPGAEPAKDVLNYAGRKLLTNEQRERLAQQPAIVEKRVEGLWDTIIKSYIGWPFRQSFDRKVTGVICGTPYSSAVVIMDAIYSLTRILVQSISEDIYGQCANDVLPIMRTYLSTLKAVQSYIKEAKPHWSDVTFSESKRDEVDEVNKVMEALTDGLDALLGAFGEYLNEMGLSKGEIQDIKAVVSEARVKKDVAARTDNAGQNGKANEPIQRKRNTKEMEQVR